MQQHPLPLASSDPTTLAVELAQGFETWAHTARQQGDHEHPTIPTRLQNPSIGVYRDMWGSFVNFCLPPLEDGVSRRLHVDPVTALSPEALESFLHGSSVRPRNGDLSPRYAWRMLHLIDRVLAFMADRRGQPRPMAARVLLERPPYRYANASNRTPMPEVLDEMQTARLIEHLQHLSDTTGSNWKLHRDHAAAAVMLGAGLTPGEVRALRLDEQRPMGLPGALPGVLQVPADAHSPVHEAPLAPWAREVLARWLSVRQRLALPGPWLFPSTSTGKPWAHPSCHKAVVAVLAAAGISGGAPFRLRHTFALRQLQAGLPEADLARCLGLADTQPLQRYQPWLTTPLPVV